MCTIMSNITMSTIKVMSAIDKDGDGEISKKEFIQHALDSDVIRSIL